MGIPSTRPFYRTVITVEVLSDEPVTFETLEEVHSAITEGDCSGQWTVTSSEQVDGPTMAKLLHAQASEPGFFQLTEHGEDVED